MLTLASFERDYGYTSAQSTRTNSLSVGLQQLGAFVACFIAWPMTDRLGRRKALMISSAVFCLGALIQTINMHSLAAFYVARVIAGLGLGSATVVVPMFSSEMAPKEMRGQVGSFFQWFFTFVSLPTFPGSSVRRNRESWSLAWQCAVSSLTATVRESLLHIGSITPYRQLFPAKNPNSGRYQLAYSSCPQPSSVSA